jgi:hypothetical protein
MERPVSADDLTRPCCEHEEELHWPEGNCRVCLDCTCDWFGERRGTPLLRVCRCPQCRPDLVEHFETMRR